MDGLPESANSMALWPTANEEFEGFVPTIPDGVAWRLLDPNADDGLQSQLRTLLEHLGSNIPANVDPNVTIDQNSGPVYIDDSAKIGPAVHIKGPCYIGPRCDVRHTAFIRENTWACSDSVIGHSTEVKHSLLFPTAKAPHFNYVGDSIIGSDANLGAGVKLSNLRNDGGEVIVRSGVHKVASRLRKFGALIGDGVQLGCNTVTNPGVILAKGCMAHPNSTVTGVHPEGTVLH